MIWDVQNKRSCKKYKVEWEKVEVRRREELWEKKRNEKMWEKIGGRGGTGEKEEKGVVGGRGRTRRCGKKKDE